LRRRGGERLVLLDGAAGHTHGARGEGREPLDGIRGRVFGVGQGAGGSNGHAGSAFQSRFPKLGLGGGGNIIGTTARCVKEFFPEGDGLPVLRGVRMVGRTSRRGGAGVRWSARLCGRCVNWAYCDGSFAGVRPESGAMPRGFAALALFAQTVFAAIEVRCRGHRARSLAVAHIDAGTQEYPCAVVGGRLWLAGEAARADGALDRSPPRHGEQVSGAL